MAGDTGRVEMTTAAAIPALKPQSDGYQFLFYGDSCSGVPDAPHAATFAEINAVVDRLEPEPEFVIFPGDEVIGLTADEAALRAQWKYWFDTEMAWLDRKRIPLYHATSNHTTYDAMSERVFADVLSHLPRNGPDDQKGLAYFIRQDDLLLVFVHTGAQHLGGEGHIETEWLSETLACNADAKFKFVVGHHPVFPVNGFQGGFQREIDPATSPAYWRLLVEHDVAAYLCSHILAFDVQVHEGVLQICSAGAGTAHRMPEGIEYLHAVQMAVDQSGLRYQVLDSAGRVRERLDWPLSLPSEDLWTKLPETKVSPFNDTPVPLCVWKISGLAADDADGTPQTFLCASDGEARLPLFWLGLTGCDQKLTAIMCPEVGRSPHYWFGPKLNASAEFEIFVAAHPHMGPGGFLWRMSDSPKWSSFAGASAWGFERMTSAAAFDIGHGPGGRDDRAFRGTGLSVGQYFTPLRSAA